MLISWDLGWLWMRTMSRGGRWVAVAPPDGSTVIALIAPKRGSEEYKLIGRSRHTVPVTADVVEI